MIKKIITLSMCLILILSLSACKAPIANEKGEMLFYSYDEIKNDGFYVHNIKDDTFSPVNNGASGYQGMTTEPDTSRFIWLGNDELDLIKLIPKVDGKDTELVGIFKSENAMPGMVVLEEYKNLGYTLGVQFTVSPDNKTLYVNNNKVCESSMMVKALAPYTKAELPVYSINESKKLPIKNVDREIDMLLGLEKEKPYEISFYDGTTYQSMVVNADTMVLKSKQVVTLQTPFKKTRQGYFVVNLPDNITTGYYYINNAGMFSFKK